MGLELGLDGGQLAAGAGEVSPSPAGRSAWVVAQVREQGHPPRQEIIEVATIVAPPAVIERLGLEEGAEVVMRRLRFLVDDEPVQLVNVYYDSKLAAGSQLERPVFIADGVHAELRRLGVQVTRFVEDFQGARLPSRDEQRALQLPSGVPVTRNIRTAYPETSR